VKANEGDDGTPTCGFCGTPPHELNHLVGSNITHSYICSHCIRCLYLQDTQIERMLHSVPPSSYEH
jgi:hypothetical protein